MRSACLSVPSPFWLEPRRLALRSAAAATSQGQGQTGRVTRMPTSKQADRRLRHGLRCLQQQQRRWWSAPWPGVVKGRGRLVGTSSIPSSSGAEASTTELLSRFSRRLGPEARLSLVPSSPATPLVEGLRLFHPSDTARWLERWAEARPEDDPMRELMAPVCGYADTPCYPRPRAARISSYSPVKSPLPCWRLAGI